MFYTTPPTAQRVRLPPLWPHVCRCGRIQRSAASASTALPAIARAGPYATALAAVASASAAALATAISAAARAVAPSAAPRAARR